MKFAEIISNGESVKVLSGKLKESGLQCVNDGLRGLWNPNKQLEEDCVHFGNRFVFQL